MESGGRESPRRARYFSLLRQRKVPKRKATPSLRPLRFATGQTCVGAIAGCAVELALRCARRSDNHGESEHEAWALRRPCHPTTAPPQAQPAGGGQPNSHTGLCFARPRLRSAWRFRPREGAERSDGPCGCPIRGFPSVCAWGAQGAGWRVCRRTHALRELTHRSCSSGAPQARSEFCGAPRDRAPQVAPQRSEGAADSRVAFSLVTFFWRSCTDRTHR